MAQKQPNTSARERVIVAAEQLFAQRGYTAVTLRDIAADVGIRHTSLYHHVPGGKEELFIEVTERTLARHHAGLTHAIAHAAPSIRAQLHAAAAWLVSQPPMDLVRMVHSDMPTIDPVHARRLSEAAYAAMLGPIEAALEQAQQRGEVRHHDLGVIAGGFLGMVEALHAVPEYVLDQGAGQPRLSMAYDLVDVLLDGLRPR